ncbi:MAG TPA: hypothetical protein VMZ33_00095, partial [Candidatus Limnocylindrales bacterium]|nr:hypothetical protein [Candidatus Limnocylindrales bacterium]
GRTRSMNKFAATAITSGMMAIAVACGGGSAPTRASVAPSLTGGIPHPPSAAAPSGPSGDLATPEGLCGLLTAADWQQFDYVTAAQPDVSSDGEGTAICTWANGLTLEVYTHADASEAEETFATVVENVPMDDPQPFYVPGSAQSVFDSDIGDDSAGMVAQAGRLTVFVSGLSRDTAQAELAALAGLVIARGSSLK